MSFLYFFWGFLCQWGLGLVTSIFSVSGLTGHWIDRLPLLIGYVIFFVGFTRMQPLSPILGKGKWGALILILLSIIQMLIPANTGAANPSLLGTVLTIVIILPEMYMIYHLCTGIAKMADDQLQPDLRDTAQKRWRLFIYCQVTIVLALLTGLFADVTQPNAWTVVTGVLSLMYVVLNLIVYILMVTLVWKAHKQLELQSK
ncbi:hypothetical protein [Paenibacillus kandeliae]|uniref:hypothetical protein n=1 Tax=Paenibacillus kandeliae TaxID=3231269 RepID=UPI00345A6513